MATTDRSSDGARGSAREVLALAWPAVINMLSLALLGTADTFFVGRIGTEPQGAVGFSATLIFSLYCFFIGTLELVQTFVAQSTGAGDRARAAHWASVGLRTSIVFSIPPTILAFFGRPLFEVSGVAPEMIPYADVYFRIRLFGTIFFFLSRIGDGYYRGIGDTMTPMLVTLVTNLTNVVLTPLLVFGWSVLRVPAMGVAGAAWATIVALALQAAIYEVLWRRRRAAGLPAPRYRDPVRRADVRELLRVGTPSGLHWFLDVAAWTLFTMAVARLGAVQAAANLIGVTLIRTSFMPGYGVSTAAQTLVGQYLGARDPASAARSGWTSVGITCAYMGVMAALYLALPDFLVGLFTKDPAVIEVGRGLMLWAALFQLGDGVQVTLAGALRGAGDTRFVMWSSLVSAWVFFVPTAFLLMFGFGRGAEGGWVAVNVWVVALALLLGARFRSNAWTKGGIDLEPRPVPEVEVT